MKTIKIIDLLNKIANGEELPKKIKYNDEIWEYYKDLGNYIRSGKPNTLFTMYYIHQILNDEAEILDEEDEFEDIEEILFTPQEFLRDGSGGTRPNKESPEYKINQLIKNQKKIIERLKDGE